MSKVQLGLVLSGHEVVELEEGAVVLAGVMMLKTLSPEGKTEWVMRHFGDPSYVELIGALVVTLDREQSEYSDGWVADGDDE